MAEFLFFGAGEMGIFLPTKWLDQSGIAINRKNEGKKA